MSMLSTQIDNLRLMARLVLDYEPAEIRRALREAADTIESLSEKLRTEWFGECELIETESYSNKNEVIHVLECSECCKTCEHINGSYPRCPHCGRKAVKR